MYPHNKMWNILKEMGIADQLTCPLRNLHAGQEAIARTRHGTTNWKILQEMGIPNHLTCLLRTCMQVKKQQLDLDMEQQTVSK